MALGAAADGLVALGLADGVALGLAEGLADGVAMGAALGLAEGEALGAALGLADCGALGLAEGLADGLAEGVAMGAACVVLLLFPSLKKFGEMDCSMFVLAPQRPFIPQFPLQQLTCSLQI